MSMFAGLGDFLSGWGQSMANDVRGIPGQVRTDLQSLIPSNSAAWWKQQPADLTTSQAQPPGVAPLSLPMSAPQQVMPQQPAAAIQIPYLTAQQPQQRTLFNPQPWAVYR